MNREYLREVPQGHYYSLFHINDVHSILGKDNRVIIKYEYYTIMYVWVKYLFTNYKYGSW